MWLACWAAYALETLVEGVPSSELYTAVLSRGSTGVLAGERSSLSPRSLQLLVSSTALFAGTASVIPYLSTSFARDVVVFLRLGAGMRHSMEKALQLVHGMPSEAASQRTCSAVMRGSDSAVVRYCDYLLS